MQRTSKHSLALVASSAVLALLAACGRPVDTPTPRTDDTAAVDRSAPAVADRTSRSTETTTGAMASGTEKAGNAIERGATKAADATADAAVTAKAKAALVAAPELKALRIDVDTKGGVVTLKGDVKSLTEKSRAEQVVAKVDGVQSVVNDLRVTG